MFGIGLDGASADADGYWLAASRFELSLVLGEWITAISYAGAYQSVATYELSQLTAKRRS